MMTRLINVITRMTATHLKAEQEISQTLLLFHGCVALQVKPFLLFNISCQ